MRYFKVQLADRQGRPLMTAGGKVYVAVNGAAQKQAIVDKAGAAMTNPLVPTRGMVEFYVASDDTTTVDLYGLTASGHAFQETGVIASGDNEIRIDIKDRYQSLVIPFALADTAAATETSTGFVIPAKAEVLPIGLGVDVTVVDSTKTIDVGTLASDSGDADGFINAVLLTTAGFKKPTLLTSGDTMGALLSVQDSANAGDDAPEGDISMQGKQITYTLSSGTTLAKGFIHLPYYLAA